MSIRRISTSAGVLALIAGLGTAAVAQTAPAGADLPAPLAQLNLTNLELDTKRDGMREVEGRTADGVEIEARIDRDGTLVSVEADDGVLPQSLVDAMIPAEVRAHQAMTLFTAFTEIGQRPEHLEIGGRQAQGQEIEVRFDRQNALAGIEMDDAAIPAELADTLLPQSVRDNDLMAQFGRIDEIGTRQGHITVRGEDADGNDMRADFDRDGRVVRFGRDDDGDGPRGDRGHGGHEPRGAGRGDHGPGDHGPRGERPMGDGPMGDGVRGDGPRGDGPRGPAPIPADFDSVAVNQKLTQAGYKDFGFLRAEGPRLMLEATNPQGEAVTLELDRQGEVVRETAR
ncbi:hypothetical protein [Paracoccus sp. (in: a-proteobacteria)]|uniref:hypothetical protein n=1 Tax=Paracoccus sp. TaxID=267 RepID=UPI0035AE39B6